MGYGGRQSIRSGDIRRFNFTGNGSNTAFDLGFTPATQNQLIVTVNGLVQHYDAFSISGSTLSFTGTPGSGDAIQVTAVVDAVGVAAIPDGAIANVSSLTVSGAAALSNSFSVTGNATFSNTVAVTGNLTTTSQLIANGDIKGITATNPTIWSANSAALTDGSMYMQFNTSSSEGRLGSYTNHPLVLLTNNSRQVILDTTGRMTIPNQPGFKIGFGSRSSGYTSAAAMGTDNGYTINTDRDCFNRGAYFNAATGRFTAPVAGIYCFAYSIMRNEGAGGAGLDIRLMKNDGGGGTVYGRSYVAAYTSNYEAHAATTFIYLNANDWVTLNLYAGSVYNDDSWFSGHLMA